MLIVERARAGVTLAYALGGLAVCVCVERAADGVARCCGRNTFAPALVLGPGAPLDCPSEARLPA